MSLSGVIFDLDGTIAESHPMAIELFGSAIADHGGKDLSPEEVVALFGPNEQGILRAAVGDEHWEEAWEAYLDGYRSRHHELCPEPFPGMTNLLDRLHECGCRIGLVTGKTKTTGTISIEFFGLDRLFSGIEGGAMVGVVKAEAIDRLRASWDLPPETVAYVGDTTLDIRESRKAGVIAVGAAWSGFADRAGLAGRNPMRCLTRSTTSPAGSNHGPVPRSTLAPWLRRRPCSRASDATPSVRSGIGHSRG